MAKAPEVPEKLVKVCVASQGLIPTRFTQLNDVPIFFPPDQVHKWRVINHVEATGNVFWKCEYDDNGVPFGRNGQPLYSSREEYIEEYGDMRTPSVWFEDEEEGGSESGGDSSGGYGAAEKPSEELPGEESDR